jgi:hypothetical protein
LVFEDILADAEPRNDILYDEALSLHVTPYEDARGPEEEEEEEEEKVDREGR